jgi:hypothetical protein
LDLQQLNIKFSYENSNILRSFLLRSHWSIFLNADWLKKLLDHFYRMLFKRRFHTKNRMKTKHLHVLQSTRKIALCKVALCSCFDPKTTLGMLREFLGLWQHKKKVWSLLQKKN